MFFQKKIKDINHARIEEAVGEFERSVDFELIPVIALRSSYVEHIAWIISLVFLVISIGLIEWLFQTVWADAWISRAPFYIAAPFVCYILGYVLDKSDRVDRFFITKSERIRQVQEKAELLFYRHRLHELKSQNALLLYISVMERQIVLKPNPNMQDPELQPLTEDVLHILQASFKKADFEEGLILAIDRLKFALSPRYPQKNAQNIVPNKLIWLKE